MAVRKCPGCNGKGKVKNKEGEKVTCPICQGDGIDPHSPQ